MKSTVLSLRLLRAIEAACEARGIHGDALCGKPDRLPSAARWIALEICLAVPPDVRRIDPIAVRELVTSAVQDHVDHVRNEDRNAG